MSAKPPQWKEGDAVEFGCFVCGHTGQGVVQKVGPFLLPMPPGGWKGFSLLGALPHHGTTWNVAFHTCTEICSNRWAVDPAIQNKALAVMQGLMRVVEKGPPKVEKP